MTLFFDYQLPEDLIAQHPAARRDESRLLVVRRATGDLEHRVFRDLPELLTAGDLLVLNDTRVLPARLVGRRAKTGGKWEGLFLRQTAEGLWELLAQTRGYAEVGEAIATELGPFRLILRGRTPDRHWLMEPDPPGEPAELLGRFGQIPLPPYVRKGRAADADADRYQTVFAERTGSVAAPTAGLHFTSELLARLADAGVGTARVTLHVGLGTFEPVKTDDPAKHRIHSEWCEVGQPTVDAILACKARSGRVVAIGTTSTRTLESAARQFSPSPLAGEGSREATGEGTAFVFPSPGSLREPPSPTRGEGLKARPVLRPFAGETGLYVRPPFEFRVIDGLVTNFHLPRTTLLLLVGAFAGSELLRKAYEEAIREKYRFYSYGDAMLIL
jgi:S-adenosylmethionine:tRNA ribosyltransferase-isomerase